MILTTLNAVAYRVHDDPKWAFAPASGVGAGMHGGRANRPGVNAHYLSLELEPALAEYKQTDALLEPALMVSYQISVEPVVDCRGGCSSEWEPLWQDFYGDWRRMHFNEGIEPPSWVIGDQVPATGAKGILFKSILTGGTNLVLYNDALTPTDSLAVHDRNRALPKNQDSWH
jgi:RES domain-containing protein